MTVKFYDQLEDSLLKFAVIIAVSEGKFVFCKHKERDTYEIPGGHREPGEDILATARRELSEETGATDFTIAPVCAYSVTGKNRVSKNGEVTYGMLYVAKVEHFEKELHSEMERVYFFDDIPSELTYPLIQPKLVEEARRRGML